MGTNATTTESAAPDSGASPWEGIETTFEDAGGRITLRTKSAAHTDLSGWQTVVQEYPDQTVTDTFRVVRKTHSAEDTGGNCYDWYDIDSRFRQQDKTGPIIEAQKDTDAMAVDCEYRLTLLELGLSEE